MIEKTLLDSLLSYAKALTNARSFADYYAELAVGEFLDQGGCFADPDRARHRLFEAFHRVWRGAQASQLRNGRMLTTPAEVAPQPAGIRRAACLLAGRERFSAAEVAGILNRPVRLVEEWLNEAGLLPRQKPLPVEVTQFATGAATTAPDRAAAPALLPPGEIRIRPDARPAPVPAPSREPAALA